MGKKVLAAGFNKAEAVKMHVSMFALVQQHTRVKTVETDTSEIIDYLKAQKIPILGLTARPVYKVDRAIELLKSVIDQLKNSHFKRIIFADDKTYHASNVGKAFKNSGIEVKSLRYGAADVRVHSYDSAVADFEWRFFLNKGVILSDEQARANMKSPPFTG